MFLIDTNVWLELLLKQEKADEVRHFFMNVDANLLSITEFSLYAIGIILTRLKKVELFKSFLSDTIEDSGVEMVRLNIDDLKHLLVSFDSDFDRTERVRKTPNEALKDFD